MLRLTLLVTSASLAAPTTQPAEHPTTQAVSHATITGVEGYVQFRQADDEPWTRADVGIQLRDTAAFRTGPRSAVRFTLPSGESIALDRLGTVSLANAIRDHGRVSTNPGMRYGRTRYDMSAEGIEHAGVRETPGGLSIAKHLKYHDVSPATRPAPLPARSDCPGCRITLPEAAATQPSK